MDESKEKPLMRFGNDFVFWYRDDESYSRIRAFCKDGDSLPESYAVWLAKAEQDLKSIAEKGMLLIKVQTDADTFIEWCKVNSREPNQSSRGLFAYSEGRKKIGKG